ncbi:MAG: GGDEF domain-containing protein [Pseudomonadota bacterium]
MQLMNGFTVLILTGVLHLILGAAGLSVRHQDEVRPALRLWLWAQLLAGVTQLFRLFRDQTPAFFSSSIPNAGAALAYGLMLIALARLFQLPERSLRWTALVLTLLHLTLRDFGFSESFRLGILSSLFALQFAQFVHVYAAAARVRRSHLLNVLQLGNLIVVLTMLARSIEAVGASEQYNFQQAGVGQVLALIGVFIGITINGFGYLMILIERGVDELQRLSTLDPLTEVMNRRSLLQHARQQLALADRAVHPIAVLICDIDHFKQINDRHGHHFGDDVICSLVAAARACMRESDCIARWGGEEFVLLLPRTDLNGARQLAERLRQHFARRELPLADQRVSATVSIGVAEHHSGEDLQQTIDRADSALLQAKQQGRNRVVLAESAATTAATTTTTTTATTTSTTTTASTKK